MSIKYIPFDDNRFNTGRARQFTKKYILSISSNADVIRHRFVAVYKKIHMLFGVFIA